MVNDEVIEHVLEDSLKQTLDEFRYDKYKTQGRIVFKSMEELIEVLERVVR